MPTTITTGPRLTALLERIEEALGPQARLDLAGALVGRATALAGKAVATSSPLGLWAKLTAKHGTGTATRYSWIEQVEEPDGGWSDGTRSGTDDGERARESTDNEDLAVDGSVIVPLWFPAVGEPRFTMSVCGS